MILLSLLVAASAAFAKGGNIVGNGGDGFYDGRRVYVRDLWEAGAYRSGPWIGEKADPALPMAAIEERMRRIGVAPELLRRKLTDVNAFRPGLGDALAKVIESYLWALTTEPIEVPPTGTVYSDTVAPPPGPRVQLAVRNYGIIRIRDDWWSLMLPEDRVALVIHEAVTSVLPLQCIFQFCDQDQTFHRVSVGMLFSGSTMKSVRDFDGARELILAGLRSAFSIPLDDFKATLTIAGREIAVSSDDQSARLAAVCERPLAERALGEIAAPELRLQGGFYLGLATEIEPASLDYRDFVHAGAVMTESRELQGVSKRDCVLELRRWLRDFRERRSQRMSSKQF